MTISNMNFTGHNDALIWSNSKLYEKLEDIEAVLETGLPPDGATEAKQDDIITELQNNGSTLTSIDTELTSQGSTLNNMELAIDSIDAKITSGEDDTLSSAQQVLVYGRQDNNPDLRAIKVDDFGNLGVTNSGITQINSKITSGTDATLTTPLQQNLVYGRDALGNLDALKTDTSGRLEVVESQAEPNLIPYTSFINGETLIARSQSTQTIDMTGYRNIQIVGQTGSANDELGLAFYDGVSAWRSDGVSAGLFSDGTINQFSLILREVGASSIKIENLQNQNINNLFVSVYRY